MNEYKRKMKHDKIWGNQHVQGFAFKRNDQNLISFNARTKWLKFSAWLDRHQKKVKRDKTWR